LRAGMYLLGRIVMVCHLFPILPDTRLTIK
jgi:hypothetical protein